MNEESVAISRELLQRGLNGEADAVGQLLELHRPYLHLLADRSLQGDIRTRIGASDIVQQTCLAAIKGFGDLNGNSPHQFLAWLRTVHQRQIIDCLRAHGLTAKRAVAREQAPDGGLPIEGGIDPLASSPSQRLLAEEDAVMLARALEQLTESQREAVRWKYLEGLTLTEVAETMATTKFSVVGLLNRGLKKLRAILQDETERDA